MISAEDLILQWGVADTEAVERRQSEVTSSWMRDELERQYESKKQYAILLLAVTFR